MNSVFSDEEISESLWSSSAAMNRSTSEWALERFLEEFNPATPTSRPPIADDDVLEIKNPDADSNHRSTAAPTDFNHYRQLLKSKLDLACAAVALSRESSSSAKLLDSATASQSQLPSQLGSPEVLDKGTFHAPLKSNAQNESDDRAIAVTALPPDQKKIAIQSRQTTSGSSKDDSDDDELDGDMDNADPSDAKRARRMLSNRESARRSRRRKQAQMSDLETQVGQLRVEHSTLLNRLSDMNHKYDNAAVDNRILKADIETLRAKVKMAEQTVKRVTGINPLVLAASNLSGTVIPPANSSLNESVNAPVPMQRNPNPMFHQVETPPMPHHHGLNGNFGENPSIPKNNLSNMGVRKLPEHQIGPSEGLQDWGAEVSPQGFAENHKPNHI